MSNNQKRKHYFHPGKYPPTSRKLAAIFFADIVSYTSLMQRDETQAHLLVEKFRETLIEKVEAHQGKIIQFYGDGCLSIFESGVHAMNCALEVQRIFQTDLIVPVRMGLHSGDVFFEANNVYGDSVNIASRIESLGVAGSVLFSKRMEKDIRNQIELQTNYLGTFHLRNVEEPIEVFALGNEGLVLPKSSELNQKLIATPFIKKNWWLAGLGILFLLVVVVWFFQTKNNPITSSVEVGNGKPLSEEIRDRKLAVMVFENQTNNPTLDVFGNMISDWISTTLMENGAKRLVSAGAVQKNMRLAEESGSRFSKATGAEVLLEGRYYQQENQLLLQAHVLDATTGNILHAFPLMKGIEEEYMNLLLQLTQQVMSYWFVGQKEQYHRKLPRYDAYQSFIRGEAMFGTDDREAAAALFEAFQRDSSFVLPLIKLIPIYTNSQQYAKADSLIQMIHSLNVPLTDYEKLRIKIFESKLNGDLRRELRVNQEIAEKFPNGNSQLDVMYIRCNMPAKVLELQQQKIRDNETKDCYTCQWAEKYQMVAYLKLDQPENVKALFENLAFDIIDIEIVVHYLRALVQLGEMDLVDQILERYKHQKLSLYGATNMNVLLPNAVSFELYLQDKNDLLDKYVKLSFQWLKEFRIPWNNRFPFNQYLYFIKRDYSTIIKNVKSLPYHPRNVGHMGACYALMGQKGKAKEMINQLEQADSRYDRGRRPYNIAKIYAALGEKEKAAAYLQKAFTLGRGHNWISYQGDIYFKSLHEYLPFEELVKPQGQISGRPNNNLPSE